MWARTLTVGTLQSCLKPISLPITPTCPEYPTGTPANCECEKDDWRKGSFTKDSNTYSYCYRPCPEYPTATSASCYCEKEDWIKGSLTKDSSTYSYCYNPCPEYPHGTSATCECERDDWSKG